MRKIMFILGLLLLVGGMIGLTATDHFMVSRYMLIAGVIISLITFIYYINTLDKNMSGMSVKYSLNTIFYSVIVIGIIVLMNYINLKHLKHIDMTGNKRYTLSPQTVKILKNLKNNIKITIFVAKTDGMKVESDDLLKQYQYVTDKIEYKFIDLNRRPDVASKLKVSKYRTTVIQCGDKKEKLDGIFDEEKLTNGIIKVTRKKQELIFFLAGHGEKDPFNEKNDGMSLLRENLENSGYIVTKLLMKDGKIPSECKILAIIGPKMNLLPKEQLALSKFVNAGGSLFLCTDPPPGVSMANFLDSLGVKSVDSVVVDKTGQDISDNPLIPVVVPSEDHPIVDNMNVQCAFPLAHCFQLKRKKNKKFEAKIFLKTHPNSYAERDYDKRPFKFNGGIDLYGPVTLGITLELKKDKKSSEVKLINNGRIVLVADSDFLANGSINFQGNHILAQNIFYWLTDNSDLIAIDAKKWDSEAIKISKKQKWTIFWIVMILIPISFVLSAIFVYMRGKF